MQTLRCGQTDGNIAVALCAAWLSCILVATGASADVTVRGKQVRRNQKKTLSENIVVEKGAGEKVSPPQKKGQGKWEKVKINEYIFSRISVGDLNGDGKMEMVVGTYSGVWVLSRDDKSPDGWRKKKVGSGRFSYAVVDDLDNDGRPEIVYADLYGRVSVVDKYGTKKREWSKRADKGGRIFSHPVVCDLDGDGNKEVLVGAGHSFYAWRHDGKSVKSWPLWPSKSFDSSLTPELEPAVADVDGDGKNEVLVTRLGEVHVLHASGQPLAGWPRRIGKGGRSQPAPSSGDLDGDGDLEIVMAAGNTVYAWHHDGTEVKGWPVRTKRKAFLTRPVIADIDGDGKKDVVVVAEDHIYVYTADGAVKKGWPGKCGGPMHDPGVYDLDKDGKFEIVVGGEEGKVWIFRHNGKVVKGWPKQAWGWIRHAPTFADIDSDGQVEIIVGSAYAGEGTINIFEWK